MSSREQIVKALGLLMGKGALIAFVLAITLLPAVILLFDRAIQVTTWKTNIQAAGASSTATYTKDENIYGILNADGSLNEMYVVNQFDVEKAGTITDKGAYDAITNLTDTSEISVDESGNRFHVEEGNFYYQGIRENGTLPWAFSIHYYLNGKEVQPDALAGAEGDLRIHVTSKKNKGVNSVFYDNFMLQISMTLDNEKAKNITAKDATIADAGTSRQINFTVMPGKDANINLKASVTDFEMNGISIAAIPFSMSVELPDTSSMTDDMSELTDGISKLNNGVGELKTGIKKYVTGVSDFGAGVQKINDNFASLANGGKSLYTGISKLKDGTQEMADGVSDMPEQMDEKVDEMMSDYVKDFTLVSFADKGNKKINAVQFTITTPEIKKTVVEKKPKTEKKPSFLERLLALF